MVVSMRSGSRSRVRVAITAGTLQPNPTIRGTKDLPGGPGPAQRPVDDEGHPTHVPGVLEKGQRQKQRTDHRDEGADQLDAAPCTVRHQRDEPGRQVCSAQQLPWTLATGALPA